MMWLDIRKRVDILEKDLCLEASPRGKQLCMHPQSLQLCPTLWPHGLQPARLLCPWDFPGKSTGVGFHALLQRTPQTQGLNPHFLHLLHCRWIIYLRSHLGSPQKDKWKTAKKWYLCVSNSTAHLNVRLHQHFSHTISLNWIYCLPRKTSFIS